jgi:hypothetical protein
MYKPQDFSSAQCLDTANPHNHHPSPLTSADTAMSDDEDSGISAAVRQNFARIFGKCDECSSRSLAMNFEES